MNILHGDSAAGSFKQAFKATQDELIVFNDVLSCAEITGEEQWCVGHHSGGEWVLIIQAYADTQSVLQSVAKKWIFLLTR